MALTIRVGVTAGIFLSGGSCFHSEVVPAAFLCGPLDKRPWKAKGVYNRLFFLFFFVFYVYFYSLLRIRFVVRNGG